MFHRKVIAEIGSVHDGSFGNALKLIEAAASHGADVVKFQTHIPESETTASAPSPSYFKGEQRYSYFARTGFSKSQWSELKECCKNCDVFFLSSPFSIEAVELLLEVGIEGFKVPSGEVTNLPMLEAIAETGLPCLLSTGMSNWNEIGEATRILVDGGGEIGVMQCTSMYPCPLERVGLNVIAEIKQKFPAVNVGFSDHTLGLESGIAAAAMGATFVEKHFTFSRLMYGSDAPLATEPAEFKIYATSIRNIWSMLASPVDKDDVSPFQEMRHIFQKSLYLKTDKKAGSVIEFNDLAFLKPADGISAANYQEIIGLRMAIDGIEGELITDKHLDHDH